MLAVEISHIQLFVNCLPHDTPAIATYMLKSITVREPSEDFPRVRPSPWCGKLWASGYYVGSAGDHVTSDLIEQYLECQKTQAAGEERLLGIIAMSTRSADNAACRG